jgi:hypothetical protein
MVMRCILCYYLFLPTRMITIPPRLLGHIALASGHMLLYAPTNIIKNLEMSGQRSSTTVLSPPGHFFDG